MDDDDISLSDLLGDHDPFLDAGPPSPSSQQQQQQQQQQQSAASADVLPPVMKKTVTREETATTVATTATTTTTTDDEEAETDSSHAAVGDTASANSSDTHPSSSHSNDQEVSTVLPVTVQENDADVGVVLLSSSLPHDGAVSSTTDAKPPLHGSNDDDYHNNIAAAANQNALERTATPTNRTSTTILHRGSSHSSNSQRKPTKHAIQTSNMNIAKQQQQQRHRGSDGSVTCSDVSSISNMDDVFERLYRSGVDRMRRRNRDDNNQGTAPSAVQHQQQLRQQQYDNQGTANSDSEQANYELFHRLHRNEKRYHPHRMDDQSKGAVRAEPSLERRLNYDSPHLFHPRSRRAGTMSATSSITTTRTTLTTRSCVYERLYRGEPRSEDEMEELRIDMQQKVMNDTRRLQQSQQQQHKEKRSTSSSKSRGGADDHLSVKSSPGNVFERLYRKAPRPRPVMIDSVTTQRAKQSLPPPAARQQPPRVITSVGPSDDPYTATSTSNTARAEAGVTKLDEARTAGAKSRLPRQNQNTASKATPVAPQMRGGSDTADRSGKRNHPWASSPLVWHEKLAPDVSPKKGARQPRKNEQVQRSTQPAASIATRRKLRGAKSSPGRKPATPAVKPTSATRKKVSGTTVTTVPVTSKGRGDRSKSSASPLTHSSNQKSSQNNRNRSETPPSSKKLTSPSTSNKGKGTTSKLSASNSSSAATPDGSLNKDTTKPLTKECAVTADVVDVGDDSFIDKGDEDSLSDMLDDILGGSSINLSSDVVQVMDEIPESKDVAPDEATAKNPTSGAAALIETSLSPVTDTPATATGVALSDAQTVDGISDPDKPVAVSSSALDESIAATAAVTAETSPKKSKVISVIVAKTVGNYDNEKRASVDVNYSAISSDEKTNIVSGDGEDASVGNDSLSDVLDDLLGGSSTNFVEAEGESNKSSDAGRLADVEEKHGDNPSHATAVVAAVPEDAGQCAEPVPATPHDDEVICHEDKNTVDDNESDLDNDLNDVLTDKNGFDIGSAENNMNIGGYGGQIVLANSVAVEDCSGSTPANTAEGTVASTPTLTEPTATTNASHAPESTRLDSTSADFGVQHTAAEAVIKCKVDVAQTPVRASESVHQDNGSQLTASQAIEIAAEETLAPVSLSVLHPKASRSDSNDPVDPLSHVVGTTTPDDRGEQAFHRNIEDCAFGSANDSAVNECHAFPECQGTSSDDLIKAGGNPGLDREGVAVIMDSSATDALVDTLVDATPRSPEVEEKDSDINIENDMAWVAAPEASRDKANNDASNEALNGTIDDLDRGEISRLPIEQAGAGQVAPEDSKKRAAPVDLSANEFGVVKDETQPAAQSKINRDAIPAEISTSASQKKKSHRHRSPLVKSLYRYYMHRSFMQVKRSTTKIQAVYRGHRVRNAFSENEVDATAVIARFAREGAVQRASVIEGGTIQSKASIGSDDQTLGSSAIHSHGKESRSYASDQISVHSAFGGRFDRILSKSIQLASPATEQLNHPTSTPASKASNSVAVRPVESVSFPSPVTKREVIQTGSLLNPSNVAASSPQRETAEKIIRDVDSPTTKATADDDAELAGVGSGDQACNEHIPDVHRVEPISVDSLPQTTSSSSDLGPANQAATTTASNADEAGAVDVATKKEPIATATDSIAQPTTPAAPATLQEEHPSSFVTDSAAIAAFEAQRKAKVQAAIRRGREMQGLLKEKSPVYASNAEMLPNSAMSTDGTVNDDRDALHGTPIKANMQHSQGPRLSNSSASNLPIGGQGLGSGTSGMYAKPPFGASARRSDGINSGTLSHKGEQQRPKADIIAAQTLSYHEETMQEMNSLVMGTATKSNSSESASSPKEQKGGFLKRFSRWRKGQSH